MPAKPYRLVFIVRFDGVTVGFGKSKPKCQRVPDHWREIVDTDIDGEVAESTY